jgi:hypothetical protein
LCKSDLSSYCDGFGGDRSECLGVVWGGLGWFGGAKLTSSKFARAICGFTNHRNKGLISVNRRTSLLSHLQYPVPIKVVYKGFNALSARKATKFGVGPKPIATREHREQIYRRFPA